MIFLSVCSQCRKKKPKKRTTTNKKKSQPAMAIHSEGSVLQEKRTKREAELHDAE